MWITEWFGVPKENHQIIHCVPKGTCFWIVNILCCIDYKNRQCTEENGFKFAKNEKKRKPDSLILFYTRSPFFFCRSYPGVDASCCSCCSSSAVFFMTGSTVVQISLKASRFSWSLFQLGPSVWILHVLPGSVCIFTRYRSNNRNNSA